MLSAIFICLGPVQSAWGRISLKMTTAIVEIIIAADGGSTASRNMGKDSRANAFAIRSVDSKMWCFWINGMIFAALALGFA